MKATIRRKPLTAAITAAILAGSGPAATAQVDLSQLGAGGPTDPKGFRIEGDNSYDRSGFSVSGAGDFDGDGLADVIIGAPFALGYSEETNAGRAYLIFAQPDGGDVDVRNLTGKGFPLNPGDGDVYLGYSVSGAGDLNGDGFADDILVAGPRSDFNAYSDAGFIYSNAFYTFSTESFARLGTSVSGAGDVNGDGFDDFVTVAIPASAYYTKGLSQFNAYVIFGKATSSAVFVDSLDPSEGFEIYSSGNYTIGRNVSGAGDVNGDGLNDVLVSAAANYPASGYAAFVVFGKTDGNPVDLDTLGSQGFKIDNGDLAYSDRLAGAGDVNGDGFSDVILGARNGGVATCYTPTYYNPGTAYVIFGKAGDADVDLTSFDGFLIGGSHYSANAGSSVAGAGDIDGDGLADLLVGVDGSYPYTSGAAFLVFGKADGDTVCLADVGGNTGGFRIDGEASGDNAGHSVSSAGDVNGDGLSDLLIGAKDADVTRVGYGSYGEGPYYYTYNNAGKSYVVFSDQTPPAAASYKASAVAGNAPPLAIGLIGDGSDASSPASRTWIDFLDGAAVSTQTVTVNRSSVVLGDDRAAVGVHWQMSTDRSGWSSADITLKYTDNELSDFDVPEEGLSIFQSASADGPWTPLSATARNPSNNTIAASVSELSFFALGAEFQALKLPDDLAAGDNFGGAVAGSGNLFAVGVPDGGPDGNGEVIIYRVEGTQIIIEARIPMPADFTGSDFGASLAIEGNRLVIAAPGAPTKSVPKGTANLQAALFQRLSGGGWDKTADLPGGGGGDEFGASVAMSGGSIVVGAPGDDDMDADAGAAHVFEFDEGDNFVGSNKVMPPSPSSGGKFGSSVDTTGGMVAISSPGSGTGSVNIWQAVGANLSSPQTVVGSQSGNGDEFGMSISMDGGALVVGSPGEDAGGMNDSGAAYLYEFDGDNFMETGHMMPSTPEAGAGFGTAVSLAGAQMAIGAPNTSVPSGGKGAVFGFSLNGTQNQLLQALSNQLGFGSSLSFDGDSFVVGAPQTNFGLGSVSVKRDPDTLFRGAFERR